MSRSDEFAIIEDIFAPLAASSPGALGLTDDAACFTPSPNRDLIITKDALVAGIHFFDSDPANLIAKKLLRVNLSDLAAKGARPLHYLLACALPREVDLRWLQTFARGLAEDQAAYGVGLLGGDTVATSGPLTLSLTALGECATGAMLKRSGAKPGDLVCVTGTIGDAGLGLRILNGQLNASGPVTETLVDRYRLPQPRIGLGQMLSTSASASIDVSDGLLADVGHIAHQSGVGVTLEASKIPFSPAGKEVMANCGVTIASMASFGDDYELCFTASVRQLEGSLRPQRECGDITVIGRVERGQGVRLIDHEGVEICVETKGYRHF